MQNKPKVVEKDQLQQGKYVEELKIQIMEQDTRIKNLEHMNRQRLRLMRANALTDFVKKTCLQTQDFFNVFSKPVRT